MKTEVYVWRTIGKKFIIDVENTSKCNLWEAVGNLPNPPEGWEEVECDITIE